MICVVKTDGYCLKILEDCNFSVNFHPKTAADTGPQGRRNLLVFAEGAVQSDGSVSANVHDDGGPLELNGTITVNPAQSLATLSGTLKERGEIPLGLKQALDQLVQLRGRDRSGRIPVDFEIAL